MVFLASARKAGSFIVSSKALRNTALRSAGIPGGATKGRAKTSLATTKSRICFCSRVSCKTGCHGHIGQFGILSRCGLQQDIDFLFRDPIAVAALHRAPGNAAQPVHFAALHGERDVGGAGKAGGQPDLGAEHVLVQLGEDVRIARRAFAAGGELLVMASFQVLIGDAFQLMQSVTSLVTLPSQVNLRASKFA